MKRIAIVLLVILLILMSTLILKKRHSASQQQKEVTQKITIKGSDTEVQLVSNLAESFREKNPEIDISITGGGSGVGIASLLNGEIDVANSSRKMSDQERESAKQKNYDLQEFILARDGLSIIVHPENPVKELSLDQIAKIYKGVISNWKEVGGLDQKIVLYGRQTTSGTYVFFRESVVKDDYSPQMRNMEGNQAIVDAVKSDKNGIGYVGVGYVRDENHQPRQDIKTIPVAKETGGKAVSPLDTEAVLNGDYPIFRAIFQYMTHVPEKDSSLDKFLRFEMSEEGEKIIEKTGFYSLTGPDLLQNKSLFEKIQ